MYIYMNNAMQMIFLTFFFFFFISHMYPSKDNRNNDTATDNIVIASFLFLPRKFINLLVYLAEGKKINNDS